MPVNADFVRHTDPFRRELLAHCYRMLGSVDEAEDLVQETYLRAWRSYAGFEGRSSLRTWLYRIATNACLTALEQRGRRALPSGLGGPLRDADLPTDLNTPEIAWLQPIPDALLAAEADPAAIVESRDSLRLGLIAALQHLPGRQRAVLLLRDVLGWPAAEVAELLGTSTIAVKSTLQRARSRLAEVAPRQENLVEPTDPDRRALLRRYLVAFENADIAALTELLREDATFEMPPLTFWLSGRAAVLRFIAGQIFGPPGALRMFATSANGQPAAAAYRRDADGVHRAHALSVLELTGTGISRVVAFLDPDLFPRFGLPAELPRFLSGAPPVHMP